MFLACINPKSCSVGSSLHNRYFEMESAFTYEIKRKVHESQSGQYNNQYLFNLRMVHDNLSVHDAAIEGFIATLRMCVYQLGIDTFNIPFVTALSDNDEKELMASILRDTDSGDMSFIAGNFSENQMWNVFFECALIGDTLLTAHEQLLDFSSVGDKVSPPSKVQARVNHILGDSIIRKNNI